jgi:dihydroneopterin aldolase
MSLATIILRNLKVPTIVGVYASERTTEQVLKLDMELHLARSTALHTDALTDTVDYDEVAKLARSFGKMRRAELLESFAYDLGQELMRRFALRGVEITAWKTVAGLLPAEVAVRVHIDRNEFERAHNNPYDEEAFED